MTALMTIEAMEKPGMALDIPKNQTFDQWVEMGRGLAEGQRVINWWIGDWWLAGERKYGEAKAAAAAIDVFGREYDTIRKYGWVCASIESGRRRTDLSFGAHVEVANLPAKEADTLLDRAETESLTVRTLRVEAMKRKVALGLFKPPERTDPDPAYDELMEGVRWWNRATAETRSEFLDLANDSALGVIRA